MRTAMMAMTTSSSIKVKAYVRFRWCLILAVFQRVESRKGRKDAGEDGARTDPLEAGPGTPRAMACRKSGSLPLGGPVVCLHFRPACLPPTLTLPHEV